MNQQPAIEIIGAPASPYTRKMIAILRYRRIPHRVHWGDASAVLEARGLPKPKVALLPTVLLNTGDSTEILIDSTPIIRKLDQLFPDRHTRPVQDPALALVDSLIEDFADEWGTKLMFHYRWTFDADIQLCGDTLPLAIAPQLSNEQASAFGKAFAERQIGRLHYVGSNEQTAPIIESAYRQLLSVLNALLEHQHFVLGDRPAAGDFALFGQLSQLALYDPTPRAICADLAPRITAWATTVEDLSGLEVSTADWRSIAEPSDQLRELLGEIGRVYVPLILANANAANQGEKTWEATVGGADWKQDTFPYQVKCLAALRNEFEELSPTARSQVLTLLNGTGCEKLFSH